uniref:Uncharacterized protein n=1 Tax=Romanomermis culicivorax TaxID=13658 RepID=A0A915HY98_ROMCU
MLKRSNPAVSPEPVNLMLRIQVTGPKHGYLATATLQPRQAIEAVQSTTKLTDLNSNNELYRTRFITIKGLLLNGTSVMENSNFRPEASSNETPRTYSKYCFLKFVDSCSSSVSCIRRFNISLNLGQMSFEPHVTAKKLENPCKRLPAAFMAFSKKEFDNDEVRLSDPYGHWSKSIMLIGQGYCVIITALING